MDVSFNLYGGINIFEDVPLSVLSIFVLVRSKWVIFHVKMRTIEYLEDIIEEADLQQTDQFIYQHKEKVLSLCKRWFRRNELATLEIDTEKKTCVVVQID